jgi:hypothetical protein
LVDSLLGLGDIVVVHDGTDYEINGAENIKLTRHLGKNGYWITTNILYKNRPKCKFYFTLPDDFLICESQITKAIEIWKSINDPKKICLSLGLLQPFSSQDVIVDALQILLLKRFAKKNPNTIFYAHSMYYLVLARAAKVNYVGTPQGSDILIKPLKSSFQP